MGKRKTFKLNTESIDSLINELNSKGAEEMFNVLRTRALMIMDDTSIVDVDTAFLNTSEVFLERAREEQEESVAKVFYTLSSICRRIAYEIHRNYIKKGVANETKNEKFIHLVSVNKNAPLM